MNTTRNDGRKGLHGMGWVWMAGLCALLVDAAVPPAFAVTATGGNTTNDLGGYRIHTFTNSATAGNFEVTVGGNVEVLVVGGGGGGGETIGGGGGGGGVIYSNAYPVIVGTYPVIVGTGGAGGWGSSYPPGVKGSNSVFGALTAIGGGAGGGYNVAAVGTGGSAGGNGGGGGARASYTPDQGNDGGVHWNNNAGGGGGGKGEVGAAGSSVSGGKGGDGQAFDISGVMAYYGGGGGGGTRNDTGPNPGDGGAGGGGKGGRSTSGTNGLANTGGGGGGGGFVSDLAGGNGGSGIVIVRYPWGIDNAGGATNVTSTSAWLNGTLHAAGETDTAVLVFWGGSDGETNLTGWARTNIWNAHQVPGDFTTNATGLSADSTYYYRFAASNESGWTWALDSSVFITGDVWIEKVSDASEIGPVPGTFTVYRASSATDAPLIVNLTIGGTAVNGTDYQGLSGTVTIPEGDSSVPIEVLPIFDHVVEGTETVQVAIASGPYVTGSPASASLEIEDFGIVTRTWGGGGANALASTPANWVEGEAPIAGDAILLNATTNKNMTWDLNVPVESWTQVGYMGTVTVATVYPGQGSFTNLAILGDCTISNGTWTHTPNPNVTYEVNRLHVSIGGNLVIGSNGTISASSAGFRAGKGPGASTGGSYGGVGGNGYSGVLALGPCYGSITAPTNLGSGGGYTSAGGAILLTVSGTIVNNGLICADGNGTDYCTGSGGSIWLTSGALSGSGTIRANGGAIPNRHSPGGGGRIALVVTNAGADFSAYSGPIQAFRGAKTVAYASCGTIYMEKAGDAPGKGEVIVDNDGAAVVYGAVADLSGVAAVTCEFSRITMRGNGVLAIGSDDTLIATDTLFWGDPATSNDGLAVNGGTLTLPGNFAYSNFFIRIGAEGSAVSPAVSLTIGTNAEFRVDKPHVMACDLIVAPGGNLTHTTNPNSHTEYYKLNLDVAGSLTVLSEGMVDVSGRGFPGNYGPGAHPATACGSSHGGLGAGGLACYGSLVAPVNLGSGGRSGYSGGGAIRLGVSGVVSNGGMIRANATEATANTGAGGSIHLIVGQLVGSGAIEANSATNVSSAGPGGGGRIAIAVTNAGADFSAYPNHMITAYGGRKTTTSGGAGTVYLRTAEQGLYEGTLIVDNDNLNGLGTEISSNVTDTTVANVLVQRKGYLLLATNQTLTVSGVWSNSASFAGLTDSAVIFAGGAGSTSRIYGATTFKGLVCTDAGHTLAFEAGSTNDVAEYGRIILRGDAATNLVLRSTADGTAWYLNVNALAEQDIEFVDVRDSDASGGATVIAKNSAGEDQQNVNWTFMVVTPGETIVWTGESNTLWGVKENWNLGRAPVETDAIAIPDGCPNYPVFDASRTVNRLTIQSGGSISLNGYALTATNGVAIAGALNAAGTETMTFQGDVDFTGGTVAPAFSTLVLAGNGAQSNNLSGLTFYKVRVDNSVDTVTLSGGFTATEFRCEAPDGTRSLAFEAGKTVTLRDLVLRGASPGATNIVLASATPGVKWNLAVSGYRSVRGVSVSHSDALSGLPIPALNSEDGGGNENWQFGVAPAMWSPTSGNSFHTAANWTPAVVPDAMTRVLVESGGPMTITGTVSILDLIVGGGTVAPTVTVNAALTVGENLVVLDKGTLTWNRPGVVSNDLIVAAGGVLTHSANADAEVNKLDLTVLGNVGVDVNGAINVSAKGYAGGKGPGTGGGGCYGGRGDYAYTGSRCYGSIMAPTNLGSGGNYNYCLGGGAIRITALGTIRHDGLMCADGVNQLNDYYSPVGGSVFLTAGALTGIGAIRAIGGNTTGGQGVGGGGRIALVVTNANGDFSAFTGPVMAFSGTVLPAGTSAGRAGAGTIYRQTGADRPKRGTVTVANNNYSTGGYTEVPVYTNGVASEADRAIFRISDAARLKLINDFTVGDIWLDTANAVLDLGSNTLTVNAREHNLGAGTVLNYGAIVWKGLPPGALIIVK